MFLQRIVRHDAIGHELSQSEHDALETFAVFHSSVLMMFNERTSPRPYGLPPLNLSDGKPSGIATNA